MPRIATRAALAGALALVLSGGLLPVTAPPASASVWVAPRPDRSVDPQTNLDEFENRILFRINEQRFAAGLSRVRYFDSCLDRYSEGWARHLAATGDFVHRDQQTVLTNCKMGWVGETLVRGKPLSPSRAVRAWMDSPEHRAVIMKPRASRAGIGVRRDSQGRIIAVLNFGDPRGA